MARGGRNLPGPGRSGRARHGLPPGTPAWRSANAEAWARYLGGEEPDGYAAPARAEDLAGLPATFIDLGEVDLFRAEDITFARRLLQAGVPTELHVYPGAYHASEVFAPTAALSQQIVGTRMAALRRALG